MRPLAFALAFIPAVAFAAEPAKPSIMGAEPAMLILQSTSATVATKDGHQTLTLKGLSPLVGFAFALHKDNRTFGGFATSDFAEHWNNCNDMKEANKMWHKDGRNALFVYASGPDNGAEAGFRKHAPLITNPDAGDREIVTGKPEGAIALFIDQAATDAAAATGRFAVRGAPLKDGTYEGIVVMTECVAT